MRTLGWIVALTIVHCAVGVMVIGAAIGTGHEPSTSLGNRIVDVLIVIHFWPAKLLQDCGIPLGTIPILFRLLLNGLCWAGIAYPTGLYLLRLARFIRLRHNADSNSMG